MQRSITQIWPNIQQDETLQDKHESNISGGQTGDLPYTGLDNVDSVGWASLRGGVLQPLAGADVAVRLINISPCEEFNYLCHVNITQ